MARLSVMGSLEGPVRGPATVGHVLASASLGGVWESNANVVTLDEVDCCDRLTGGWPTRALLCKVYRA